MDTRRGRRLTFGIFSSILIFLSFILFERYSITAEKVLTFPLQFPNLFLSIRSEVTFSDTVFQIIYNLLNYIIPFIPLVIGFSLLAVYGRNYGEDVKLGVFSTLLPVGIGIFYLGYTVPVLFFSISIVLGGFLVTGLGKTYRLELEKWRSYRVGTHSLGKILLLINVFLTVSLFLLLLTNINYYEKVYKDETKELVYQLFPQVSSEGVYEMSEEEILQMLPSEQREMFLQLPEDQRQVMLEEARKNLSGLTGTIDLKIDEMLNSPKLAALIDFSLLLMVAFVWSILELLRVLFFTQMAGILTLVTKPRKYKPREQLEKLIAVKEKIKKTKTEEKSKKKEEKVEELPSEKKGTGKKEVEKKTEKPKESKPKKEEPKEEKSEKKSEETSSDKKETEEKKPEKT